MDEEIEKLRPDEQLLEKHSESFDIDEDLEAEFNKIQEAIYNLKIKYESLIKIREIAANG
jgi:hypothetical protein